jgi:hypothetical protein
LRGFNVRLVGSGLSSSFDKESTGMRNIIIALSALGLLASSAPSIAGAPCRDAKGKFIKCPAKKAAKPTRCRDASGKFLKCGTKGARSA